MEVANRKTYTTSWFCECLRSLDASFGEGQIVSITHWKEQKTLLLHEFLVFRASLNGGEIFLRIERKSNRRGPWYDLRNWELAPPAKDIVIMATEEEMVLQGGTNIVMGRVLFKDDPPTLLDLERVLGAVCNESQEYRVYSENCYFFASTLMRIFATLYNGVRRGP